MHIFIDNNNNMDNKQLDKIFEYCTIICPSPITSSAATRDPSRSTGPLPAPFLSLQPSGRSLPGTVSLFHLQVLSRDHVN